MTSIFDEKRKVLHWGWYVMLSSFIILFFNSGSRYSFGVMFKPMIEEFGWSRGPISFAFFINMIVYAFLLTVVGRFYDRFGPRWVLIIATIFLFIGFSLIAFIKSLWEFYLYYGIFVAIGFAGTSLLLFAALISKWFSKWRGFVISLSLSGSCLGQFALLPVFTFITQRYGWRISYLISGILMIVVNIPLIIFIIKKGPDDIGLTPYGFQRNDGINEKKERYLLAKNHPDMSLNEAMHTRSFWFFVFVMFVCGSGDFWMITHLIPFATDKGISPYTAGNIMAWFGLFGLLGVLTAGPASDLIGNKIPLTLTFFIRFISFIIILYCQNTVSFYIFGLSFGFTFLITAPITATLLGKLYGFSHIGFISGFVTTFHHLGGGFWAYMGGWLFDKTGDYEVSLYLSALMALLAFILSFLIKEKRHKISQN